MSKDKPKPNRWDVTANITGPMHPGQMPPNPLYPGAMPPQPMYGPPTLMPYNSGRVTLGGNAARGYVQPMPGNNSGIVVPYNGDPDRQYALRAEERVEPVVGWRRYALGGETSEELTLFGQRVEWPEATLVAICQVDIDTQIFTQLTAQWGDKGAEVFKAYAAATRGVENSGQRLAAEHIRDGFCQCGIYGGGTPDQTMGSGQVLAKCQAWGYVAVDEVGNWKATHARIEAMWLLKGQMTFSHWVDFARVTAFLRQRYGCPVFVVEDVDEVPR